MNELVSATPCYAMINGTLAPVGLAAVHAELGVPIRKVRPLKFTPTSVAFTSNNGPPAPDNVHTGGGAVVVVVVVVVVEFPTVTAGGAGTSNETGVGVQFATSHAPATAANAPTASRARQPRRRRTADPVIAVQATTASPRVSTTLGDIVRTLSLR